MRFRGARRRIAVIAAASAVALGAVVAPSGTAAAARPPRPTTSTTTTTTTPSSTTTTTTAPSQPNGALVLYDTTGQWGWLGELDAMYTANLAGHFGRVVTHPVTQYTQGEMSSYAAVLYIGSTYGEPLPAAFTQDVVTLPTPVLWAGLNVWDLSNGYTPANTTATFTARYGWDAGNSLFDQSTVTEVDYKNQAFTRNALNNAPGSCGSCIVHPQVTDPSLVTAVANAKRSDGTTFPWAIRAANLTYIGEIPFSYVKETDRVLVYSDLLFDALAPSTPTRHRALVRLEDVSPKSDPAQLEQIAKDLHDRGVPFSVNVIPVYTDPNGYYNNGKPETIRLRDAPEFVNALKYMVSQGGVLNMEGYTHQYSNIANPYDGVSGDDFEFYRAQCSTTQSAPFNFESPCQNTDWVIMQGPLSQDSATWASGRISSGLQEMSRAGLPAPVSYIFPHYAASYVDYKAEVPMIPARYDRALYFGGTLSGGAIDYSHLIGQFFPYVTRDVYGAKVLPENLGDYEPVAVNNNPPRLPADIVHNAQLNLAVRDGWASFFYDPSEGPSALDQTIDGIKGLGYTFVSPSGLSS